MTPLHPWALLAGLAVGLPVLIHWLTRPRPVRLGLSTIRFVREAVQQRRARHRLRDILLLLLRVAAVLLIAAAFARPLLGNRPLIAAEASGGAARVVLIDQSLGMAEVTGGATAFDRARATAARYLAYSPGAKANLILAAARPRAVVERLTDNYPALRDELATATPLPQRLNTAAAVGLAAELLSSGPAEQTRELIVVSNFQRSNWSNADFSALPRGTKILLESVAPASAPANLAVLRVASRGRIEQGKESRIEVDVGNYSPASREVEVLLTAGRVSATLKGLCPPGVKTTLSTTVIPTEVGWFTGEARLAGVEDALAADNVRPFVLNVSPGPTYLLITREQASPQPTSSHFLELALAPFAAGNATGARTEHVRRTAAESFDRDSAASADLLVLDHPGKLSTQQIGLLTALLHRGRPVLYIAAEPVDATNLDLLARSAGRDMKMPVEFVPPPAAAPRRDLFLAEIRRNAPPFAAFGESLAAAVGPLRFGGGLGSHAAPGGLAEDVLAEYSDHSACLVTANCGAGTLAVLNADLNQSNLVSSPVFVPLLDELVDRLLARQGKEDAAAPGEAMAAYLPAEAGTAEKLEVHGAAPSTEPRGTLSDDAGFVLWRWNSAGPPGVYTVNREGRAVFALATAAPAGVSDLTALSPELLKTRLSGESHLAVHSAEQGAEHRDNLWAWVLVACSVCMLLELLALKAFRT